MTLYNIMSDPTKQHIVTWGDEGKTVLMRRKRLEDELLGVHFNIKSMPAFTRHLQQYHFQIKSSKTDPDLQTLQHPYFIRGQQHLLSQMVKASTRRGRTYSGGRKEEVHQEVKVLQQEQRCASLAQQLQDAQRQNILLRETMAAIQKEQSEVWAKILELQESQAMLQQEQMGKF